MKKFDGVLLVSDFDETLCCAGAAVSEENLAALRYFTAGGGHFTVATGRSLRTFFTRAGALPLNAPAIVSNGAAIYDFSAGTLVEEHVLPSRIVADCHRLAEAFPAIAFETYFGEGAYVYRPNEITALHGERVGVMAVETPLEEIPQPWIKVLLEGEASVLRAAQRFIQRNWDGVYEAIFSHPSLLEVTADGCTKGGAVLRLARLLGIEAEHLYCVGDNQNDLPMLRLARIGFCPRGAVPEVLRSGARVVASCQEHCLREVVEILAGRYP